MSAPSGRSSLQGFVDNYIQSAMQLMVVIDHMRRSIAIGAGHEDAPPIHVVLETLLTDTFAHHADRPSRRDLATAARVLDWAMETTSREIFLVPLELEPED